jgi:hypothetical protein
MQSSRANYSSRTSRIRATLMKGPLSVAQIVYHGNRYIARPEHAILEWKRHINNARASRERDRRGWSLSQEPYQPSPKLDLAALKLDLAEQIEQGVRYLIRTALYSLRRQGHVVTAGPDQDGDQQYGLTDKGRRFQMKISEKELKRASRPS